MSDVDWLLVADIFAEAMDQPDNRRADFIAARCSDRPAELSAVERLVAAENAGFLNGLDRSMVAAIMYYSDVEPGRAGPYRLVREIGRGGMGQVFLAERDDGQFQQRAAVKLIKRGMDSDAILRRFLHERQILARLQHPHIARLYDGGVTDDGRPFFAMEYVEGAPITRYCDDQRLGVESRLALFRDVCRAVQYAHQNLVVHRDLKPSNMTVDADGQLKLLDFGIAKLLDPTGESDVQTLTDAALRLMTPEYAAPEQIRGEAITTATDVFALGVVLYELLSGHRPWRQDRRNADTIPAVDPLRPSAAAMRTEEVRYADGTRETITPEMVSHARGTTPDRLRRRLSGDLDTVVLEALKREPQRRYASVQALLDDLERHLTRLPVRAHRDTALYRASKFVQRHAAGVASTVAIGVLLAGSAGALAVQQKRTANERDKAEHVKEFVLGLFAAANPAEEANGDTVSARTLLERGVERIDQELAEQPVVQAEMLAVIGDAFKELGNFDRAAPLFERALALRRELLPREHIDLASSLHDMASLKMEQGNYEEAESLHREALAMRTRLLGPAHLDVASSLNSLGVVLRLRAKDEESEERYRQALAIRREQLGAEHAEVLSTLNNLAMLMQATGNYERADSLHREVLATRRRVLGDEHLHVAISLNNLGTLLLLKGESEESAAAHREGLAIQRKLLDADHPDIALSLSNLGASLARMGRNDEAEPLYREAIALRLKRLGPDHPTILSSQQNLGVLLYQKGDVAGAESMFRLVVTKRRELLGVHPNTGLALFSLGRLLTEEGRAREAEPALREAVSVFEQALPEGDWRIAMAQSALGASLSALGRYDEAEPLLLDGFTRLKEAPGVSEATIRRASDSLAAHYERRGMQEQAAAFRTAAESR